MELHTSLIEGGRLSKVPCFVVFFALQHRFLLLKGPEAAELSRSSRNHVLLGLAPLPSCRKKQQGRGWSGPG